jgi:hypothetical protein
MIDIQAMVDKGEPIYVVNRSARILGKSHLLVLTFPNPSGGRGSTVKIPAIKYPINLSRRVAPPSAIPMSQEFVNWVNRGVLQIVPQDKAREVLKDPQAQNAIRAAYRKLDNQSRTAANMRQSPNFNVKHGGARETRAYADLGESDLTVRDFYGMTPEDAHPHVDVAPQKELHVAETDAVSPKVQRFCNDLLEDESLKKDFLTTLKGWDEDELSDEELGYMLDALGKFENISSYIRGVMAERAGRKSVDSMAVSTDPSGVDLDDWLEE